MKEMKEAVVKIDSELMKKIEKFMKSNKYAYTSKKQVVNLAIIEFLNNHSIKLNEKKRAR